MGYQARQQEMLPDTRFLRRLWSPLQPAASPAMDQFAEFKAYIAASDAEAKSIEVQLAETRADIDERVAALRTELAKRLDSPAAALAAARRTSDRLKQSQGAETDRLLGAWKAGGFLMMNDAKSTRARCRGRSGRTSPSEPFLWRPAAVSVGGTKQGRGHGHATAGPRRGPQHGED